jgi:hypothetical protein
MRRLLLVVVLAGSAGCPSDPPPACITVDTACAPLYDATSFANVYEKTIKGSCGSTMASCHSAQGRAGGLSFEDQQTAYEQLMLEGRVKAGNPGCSEMVVRTSSPGEDYQMPPGDPISEAARCALIQWVQQGAMP